MEAFYPFFVVIFAAVFFSMIVGRLHVPWVIGLILGGILIGPYGLGILEPNSTVDFIGQLGLIFLMFMAGMETKLSNFRGFQGRLLGTAFINGSVPFMVGVSIGFLFGYGWLPALLIGVIFVSSSIAIIIPSLESRGLLYSRLGQSVVITIIIQDVASLVMLSFILQTISPVTKLPLYLFYPLILMVLVVFRLLLPKLNWLLTNGVTKEKDLFQQEFRSTFLVLLGTVLVFQLLGLHPIIAGFFAGLVLSESMTSTVLKDKIRTISYGIFIPTFFILVGSQTDLSVLGRGADAWPLVLAIIFGSMLSKFVSGWIGGRFAGFSTNESLLFGISSTPQLSTTLAVAFSALSLGLIDQKLITAMIALSVATVIVSPILLNVFSARIKETF